MANNMWHNDVKAVELILANRWLNVKLQKHIQTQWKQQLHKTKTNVAVTFVACRWRKYQNFGHLLLLLSLEAKTTCLHLDVWTAAAAAGNVGHVWETAN